MTPGTGTSRPAFAARPTSAEASARAGCASGTPSAADVRPFSTAFNASQFASTSPAVFAVRPGEDVRVPADEFVGDASGHIVDVPAFGVLRDPRMKNDL